MSLVDPARPATVAQIDELVNMSEDAITDKYKARKIEAKGELEAN